MRAQSGFTLIELMIVVAIIAILAAIAIPQYNDYTARAQLSEAIGLTSGFKAAIGSAYAQASEAGSCQIPLNSVTTGKYVESIVPGPASAASCELIATMRMAAATKVRGRTITIQYTPLNGEWRCRSNAPPEVVPSGCR